ncbi:MAG TPA: GntR family transcriptional regulator [Candidatus Sulfotelmatobacter sp.]|nr:GntR family transcriptional regulator [Candidatus Sulfotelmatobacter sp.]
MRFWFARNGGVPIREQLVTQVILGILCDELAPGQRLPSTRELARRFRLHPNTVSAAYRQLQIDRWVEFRHGSGVYVRKSRPELPRSSALALDQLIANLFRSARELGVSLPAVQARLRHWLSLQPPDRFLLIEPDAELRRIVLFEMSRAVKFPVAGEALDACRSPEKLEGAIPVVLANKQEAVRQALPPGTELLALSVQSVPRSLGEWLPAPSDTLIGIASGWPGFLKLARTMLTAAGFHRDGMIFRNTSEPGWQRGLKQAAAVICDSVTSAGLPKGCRAIPFALLSDSAITELQRYQQFILEPLA